MIRRVKKAFVDNFPNLEWMDNATRAAAVGKASVKIIVFVVLFYCAMLSHCNSVCLSVCHTRELSKHLCELGWFLVLFTVLQLASEFGTATLRML